MLIVSGLNIYEYKLCYPRMFLFTQLAPATMMDLYQTFVILIPVNANVKVILVAKTVINVVTDITDFRRVPVSFSKIQHFSF